MLHIDGFDQFNGDTHLIASLVRSGYTAVGTLAPVTGRAAGSTAISVRSGTITRPVPYSGPRLTVGFAHQFTDRGACVKLGLGAESITLWFNPANGLPMLNDTQGNALPIINTWYYIELALDKESHICQLWINGKMDSGIAMTTSMAAATSCDVILGHQPLVDGDGNPIVDNSVKTYDDFYARGDYRLGPVVITTRFPTVDNHVQWFKAGGEATHAATVGVLPADPLNRYIASDTIGQEDRFTSAAVVSNPNAIVATALVVLARKSDTLDAHLNVFMGQTGGAELRQSTLTVDGIWRSQYSCYEQVVTDTPANIQASQFGVAVVT